MSATLSLSELNPIRTRQRPRLQDGLTARDRDACTPAVGRRPNTDDLGLEKAGIAHDNRGYIVVDDELRTNVPGIWAVGDCDGKADLPTHPITTLRLLRRIFWRTITAESAIAFRPTRCTPILRWGTWE